MIRRSLSYSLCLALVVISVSYILHRSAGRFLLWPGQLVEDIFNLVLLALPTGDAFYSLPSGSFLILNTLFYTFMFFGLMVLWGWLKRTRNT